MKLLLLTLLSIYLTSCNDTREKPKPKVMDTIQIQSSEIEMHEEDYENESLDVSTILDYIE